MNFQDFKISISDKISEFQARFQDFVSDFGISAKISHRISDCKIAQDCRISLEISLEGYKITPSCGPLGTYEYIPMLSLEEPVSNFPHQHKWKIDCFLLISKQHVWFLLMCMGVYQYREHGHW